MMVQKSGEHQLRLVLEIPLCTTPCCFFTSESQVVPYSRISEASTVGCCQRYLPSTQPSGHAFPRHHPLQHMRHWIQPCDCLAALPLWRHKTHGKTVGYNVTWWFYIHMMLFIKQPLKAVEVSQIYMILFVKPKLGTLTFVLRNI